MQTTKQNTSYKKTPKPGRTVSIYTTVKGRSFEADVISKKNQLSIQTLVISTHLL